MATFKLITDAGKIQVMIDSIGTRYKSLDHDVQRAACSIVAHVNEHYEVSLVNNLIGALGKGVRVNALREWFDTHCACLFDEEAQVFVQAKKEDNVPPSKMELVLAAKPWYDHKAEAKFVPVDAEALVKAAIKKITKALESGDDRHKCTLSDLSLLQALEAQLGCTDETPAEEEQPVISEDIVTNEVIDPLANIASA